MYYGLWLIFLSNIKCALLYELYFCFLESVIKYSQELINPNPNVGLSIISFKIYLLVFDFYVYYY